MNPNVEIFKECEDGRLTMQEVDEILKATDDNGNGRRGFMFYDDRANGYVAFALFKGLTREDADNLVNRLNNLCEENEEEPNWYLGDEDEEYVFVN